MNQVFNQRRAVGFFIRRFRSNQARGALDAHHGFTYEDARDVALHGCAVSPATEHQLLRAQQGALHRVHIHHHVACESERLLFVARVVAVSLSYITNRRQRHRFGAAHHHHLIREGDVGYG